MEVKDGQSTYHKIPGEGDFPLDQFVGLAVGRRIEEYFWNCIRGEGL